MTPINPRISLWVDTYNPKKGDTLQEQNLYTVLKYCETIDPSTEKGKSGSIFPFLSSTINTSDKYSDGVLFIDFDNCSNYSELIFNSFEKLCQKLPNILGVNFSHSGNLHFYLYDEVVKENPKKYGERNLLYMCCLSQVIKVVTGIDLRDIEGCLDTHTKSFYQRFFLSQSKFQWNPYCCSTSLGKDQEKKLRSEYHKWIRFGSMNPVVIDLPKIDFTGSIVVDSKFYINTKKGVVSGYEARTVIVASTYHHFNNDLDKSIEYICNTFKNFDPMCRQLRSMVSTGSVNYLWDSTTEMILFPSETGIILKEDEYLSDKLNIEEELNEKKYLYICSNTGTGKSELVKRYMKEHPEINVIYIQMMKSILKGKYHQIEKITINNTDRVDREKKYTHIHLTMDKLIGGSFKNIDPNKYVVFVDESHLLQDHVSFRRSTIESFCSFLSKCKNVIFLSATPKSDIRLFDFKRLVYTKIQKQKLDIHQIPINLIGKGHKESTYYKYMIDDIEQRSRGRHITIFTNKKEKEWLEYGLRDKDITRFRSDFYNDDNVKSVLIDNTIRTKWCLSTSYMSVGVEVKHGKHVVVFDIHEGIDISHIIQSIGRFRPGVIDELEVLIYYRHGKLPYHPIDIEYIDNINTVWNNLLVDGCCGKTMNILSSRILNIKGLEPYSIETLSMMKELTISNIIESNDFYSPHSYQVLKSLPYSSVIVTNEEVNNVSTDGSKKRVIRETKLIHYLKSKTDEYVISLGSDNDEELGGYERVWRNTEVPYNDKVEGRKTIRMCKFIIYMGLPLCQTLDYFNDDIKTSYKYSQLINDYVRLEKGQKVISEFNGSEKTLEKINYEQSIVKDIFTEEFLKWCCTEHRVKLFVESICEDPYLLELCDLLDIPYDVEETVKIKIFNDKTFKDYKLRNKENNGRSLGGKISSPKKKITIIHSETNEVVSFDSKGDCMRFLKLSPRTFSKLIKGNTVRGCKWIVSIL